jgi:glutamyl-tRNA synthetase
MIRVRFIAPVAGALLVSGARVALANAMFARSQQGHFTLRVPAGEDRITADLRWLGIGWDAVGQTGDYAAAIDHLKSIDRLYPCFESETELRAKREFRIRRGHAAVYDRAMLRLTPEQREAAEAGGKRPHWRFRLSNRVVTWIDASSGRKEAKLPAVSDPVLVAADGTPAAALTAVVDDIADGIGHVIGSGDGESTIGIHIDLLSSLGQNPDATTFAQLPPLGDTGRRAMHHFRHEGIDPEALVEWLGGGKDFSLRRMARKLDPVALPPLNREVLARREFAEVVERLPPGATEPFWLAIRGHIDLLTEARHWRDVVNGTIFPPVPEGAAGMLDKARQSLPGEPWDETTWPAWLAAIPVDANSDNAATLRLILTGEEQGPELAALLPLIGRLRVLERLRLVQGKT